MKKYLSLSFVMVMLLAALPLSVFAQDDETATFTSEDELLTVTYPADWVAEEAADFPGVQLASSQDTLDRSNESSNPEAQAGDATVQVILFPNDFLGLIGIELTEDGTPEEVAQLVADFFAQSSQPAPDATEEADAPEVTLEEPTTVELEDGTEVSFVRFSESKSGTSGLILGYQLSDGVFLIGAATAFSDDYDEELETVFLETILSTEYSGTGEDLLAAFGG